MTSATSSRSQRSSRRNPCPVCGRTKDEDCEIRIDGMVFCHRGSTCSPPPEAQRPGDVVTGADGQRWAYLGDSDLGKAMFRLDSPLPASNGNGRGRHPTPAEVFGDAVAQAPPAPLPGRPIRLARLPEGAALPDLNRERATYVYGPTQQTRRAPDGKGEKAIRPYHPKGGRWVCGAGPDPWPLYQQEQAVRTASGTGSMWLLELEGERCVAIAMAAGLAAISQPGHNHTPAAIAARYAVLAAAGKGVVYVADNDEEGERKAERCAAAAAAVGLPFLRLSASEVWPGIRQKGSIDDAPGTLADQLLALEEAANLAAAAAAMVRATAEELPDPATAAQQEPRSVAAPPADAVDRTVAREQLAAYLSNITADLPLDEVLPARLARLLTDRAAAFPCDPVALLGPLLAVAASIVGVRGRVLVKEGWPEPLIVWAGNVLPPSALKSPTAAVLSGPLMELQKDAFLASGTPFEDESGDGATAPQGAPSPRRFLTIDCTYERLVELMAQPNTPGLLSYFDELGMWFASLERTNSGHARGGWLSSWTGGASLVDRKTATSSFAEKTAISLFGNIQPEKLKSLIADGGGDPTKAGDGLWCRFLWCRPSEAPWRYVEKAVDIQAEMVALLKALDSVGPDAFVLKLDRSAIALAQPTWDEWAIEAQDSDPARAAFLGKLRGYSVRLAGIFHLLHLAELVQGAGLPLSSVIKRQGDGGRHDLLGADSMARGLKAASFYLQQFDALQPEVGGGDVPADVAGFLRRVVDRELQEVAPRDVQQWKLLGKRATAKEALELLQEVVSRGHGEMAKGARKDSWRWVRGNC